ncbi:UNVERIFIED_CONTAM: hypothetical protein FKN15_059549 [Acipenser sinensis]
MVFKERELHLPHFRNMFAALSAAAMFSIPWLCATESHNPAARQHLLFFFPNN